MDEPPVLLGEDYGAKPAEYALAALNGCLITTFVFLASAQGVKIEGIESTLTGDIDARGTLGLKEDVRNGSEKIKVTFKVTSNAPKEKIRELIEFAQKRSPVFDIFLPHSSICVTTGIGGEGDNNEQIQIRGNNTMSDDFSEYLIDTMNKGALSLMLSIGHRAKLFDVMSALPPSSIKEIAEQSKLKERYVREWLGAMVAGKIVDFDPENNTFTLPKEKAQYLTRAGEIYNFAASMQWIPVLAQVEDEIVECFGKGGGVPYTSYHRFHEVMAEESYQTVVVGLTEHILPLVPDLIRKLEKGIKVLDIGCGMGKAVNTMAKSFPNSTFYGYDLSSQAIEAARNEATAMGTPNTVFQVQDILNLTFDDKFDLITAFDAIHDQPKPGEVLSNIYRSLSNGGIFLMQDILASTPLKDNIEHPLGPFLYTISCLHCVSVSLSQNGAGLGAMWGKEKAVEMLKESGFSNVEVKTLSHDFQNYYYVGYKGKAML